MMPGLWTGLIRVIFLIFYHYTSGHNIILYYFLLRSGLMKYNDKIGK